MSKIDIAIKVTSDGAGEPIAIAGGKWTQNVIDIHPVLNNLQGLDVEGQTARILSFTDDGCIVTLARLVPGRGGDNVAAWIFIPANADIAGNEVVGIVEKTESVIASSQFDLQPLRELCEKEYPDRIPFSQAPTGNRLAFRRYDSTSLPQLLGSNRYQPYYNDYRYILLLDDSGQIELRKEADAVDLTRQLVGSVSMLLPPDAGNLHRHFGQPVSVTLADGTLFDHPVPVKKGESIMVYFVRDGFNPVECGVRKDDNGAFSKWILPDRSRVKWKKTIDSSFFRFVDERGKELPADIHPTIKVNGRELSAAGMEIDEGNLRQANVVADAKQQGYEGDSAFFDLSQPAPYTLRLTRRVRDYNNKVEMRNGQTAQMTLVSKYLEDGKDGPLAGYTYDRTTHHLVYDKSRVWAHRAQGLLAGLLLMGLCWGISAIVGSQKANKTDIAVVDEPKQDVGSMLTDTTGQQMPPNTQNTIDANPTPGATVYNTSITEAIAYLDSHSTWVRTDMENFDNLRGLFDAMNYFDLDDLCGFWKVQLKDSKRFKDVADYAQAVRLKGKDPTQGGHTPTYNKPGDEMIAVQNYINWLSETIRPKQSSAPSPAPVKPANNKQAQKPASNTNSNSKPKAKLNQAQPAVTGVTEKYKP